MSFFLSDLGHGRNKAYTDAASFVQFCSRICADVSCFTILLSSTSEPAACSPSLLSLLTFSPLSISRPFLHSQIRLDGYQVRGDEVSRSGKAVAEDGELDLFSFPPSSSSSTSRREPSFPLLLVKKIELIFFSFVSIYRPSTTVPTSLPSPSLRPQK